MIFKSRFQTASILFLVIGQLTLAQAANALVPKQDESSLESLAFISETLQANPHSVDFDEVRDTDAAGIASTWEGFRKGHGDWSAIVDRRTGKIEVAEGEGIPFVPGRGNQLRMEDISADFVEDADPGLTELEAIARAFLPDVADMLGVDPATLVLNRGRSGHPADYLWFVDFDVILDETPVEGARVVFRVNNGNLVQFGSENLPAEGIHTPKGRMTRNQALSVLASYIGGFSAADSFSDGGSQHLIPVALPNSQFPDGFERGKGRGLTRVWQFVFHRHGNDGTWRARIDATTGKLLEFRDINDYASAQVAGGVTSLSGTEPRPMPFADISSGGYTNSAGVYNYTSGTISSALNGQYVKINDGCGALSLTSDSSGNLAFGNSSGTDCDTPGFGGAGNTRSSRTQFYTINRAMEIARGWLNIPWLNAQLTVNVNLANEQGDGVCNAFWKDGTLNLYRSKSSSCSNSGEIQGVALHEYGHGLDSNDGNGLSPDKGTGETYGDWMAALITHNSCIGAGFLPSNCDGFGDACISCTGVRDIDYAKHSSGTPHTVGNFTQVFCPAGNGYNGPCDREGHCESQVSSEALWDLAVRDLPNLGLGPDSSWAIMDRLWYLSRSTATAAFTCFKATSPWSSNGCGSGSLWKTMRVVDDDDGNLSNGTPHSTALYAAFNRHGIACASDAGANTGFSGCTQQPTVPVISLASADNQVAVNWSGSSGVYDVYRNEQGCGAGGFVKIANNLTDLSFIDADVANYFTYYYRVIAQSSSNEACPLALSPCLEAVPCSRPSPPAGLVASPPNGNRVDLSWTESPGATRYHIYRATSSGGPYIRIGTWNGNTFSDVDLRCGMTYYYMVRAAKNETCESGNSNQILVSTNGCLLTSSKIGTGAGTVSSSPTGVNCGTDCSEPHFYNTNVTLTATPEIGSVFSGWEGECTGTGACNLAMTQDRTVTAVFSMIHSLSAYAVGSYDAQGRVTSTPAGINCGMDCQYQENSTSCEADCKESYLANTSVTLTALPGEKTVFSGWHGDCAGTGTCTLNMTQDHNVRAGFRSLYNLEIYFSNWHGVGSVTSVPAGINCSSEGGWDCSEYYPAGTSVTLTAVVDESSAFLGWGGWGCNDTGPCTVTVNYGDFFLMPKIVEKPTLRVFVNSGLGMVTSTPEGINCGTVWGCSKVYDPGTSVTLTATPTPGWVFSGWQGACSGTGTCTVIMPGDSSWWPSVDVRAEFSVATYNLAVSLAGTGKGTVTTAGISCGTDCSETYQYNTSVTLTATPSSPSSGFKSWSGACTGTGSCTVTMDQAKSVTATFEDKGRDFYTIIPPCRVFDSRITGARLTSQVPLIINIAGNCGVPATAQAVSLNVTAIAAPGDGFITLYPGDITLPGTWTIGFPASLNRANNAVIPLAWNGNGTLAAVAVITGGGIMDMALDVNGYFE